MHEANGGIKTSQTNYQKKPNLSQFAYCIIHQKVGNWGKQLRQNEIISHRAGHNRSEVKSGAAASLSVLNKPRNIHPQVLWWPWGQTRTTSALCPLTRGLSQSDSLTCDPWGPSSFRSQTLSSWPTCRWSFLREDITVAPASRSLW